MNTRHAIYNVVCRDCGDIFHPKQGSTVWWRAKQREEEYLDALMVSGKEHGCVLFARYKVFGYDDMCRNFETPYVSVVKAMLDYLELSQDPALTVFFDGGSAELRERLRELSRSWDPDEHYPNKKHRICEDTIYELEEWWDDSPMPNTFDLPPRGYLESGDSPYGPAGIFSTDNPQSDRMQILAEGYDPDEDEDDWGYEDQEDCPYCGAPPQYCTCP